MRFEIYPDKAKPGQWRWRLRFKGDIIAVPGEGHESKEDCLKEIDLVRGSARAPAYDEDDKLIKPGRPIGPSQYVDNNLFK